MTAIIGAILMLIDHIGAILYPQVMWLRLVGRLSFPLFAYGIARGVENTSNFRNYFTRILVAAVISQPIYWLVFGMTSGNPLFTLAYGALVLWLWKADERKKRILATCLIMVSAFLHFSYGWYGVLTIFAFQFYRERKRACFWMLAGLQVGYVLGGGSPTQVLALLAIVIIEGVGDRRVPLPKYFFYAFYPLHLLAIWSFA